MTELDPDLQGLLTRTRSSLGPPPGAEARLLAEFHARLDGPPPQAPVEAAQAGHGAAQLIHGLKVLGAVVGLSAAGLSGLWAVGQATRERPPVAARTLGAPITESRDDRSAASNAAPSPSVAPDRRATTPSPPPKPAPSAQPPTSRTEPTAAPQSAATLAAELRLIQAARAASPTQSLGLLATHAKEFPTGELSLEREALSAIAWCELGRTDRAAAHRDALAAAPALSPLLRDKVVAACGPEDKN